MADFEKFLKDNNFSVSPKEDKQPFVYSLFFSYNATHQIATMEISQGDMRRARIMDEYLSQNQDVSDTNFMKMVKEIKDEKFYQLLSHYPTGQESAVNDLIEKGSLYFAERYNNNQTRTMDRQF